MRWCGLPAHMMDFSNPGLMSAKRLSAILMRSSTWYSVFGGRLVGGSAVALACQLSLVGRREMIRTDTKRISDENERISDPGGLIEDSCERLHHTEFCFNVGL